MAALSHADAAQSSAQSATENSDDMANAKTYAAVVATGPPPPPPTLTARLLTALYVVYYVVNSTMRNTLLSLLYRCLPTSAFTALPLLPHPYTTHVPAVAGRGGRRNDSGELFVLVTGTSTGIGWDAALTLSARGYSVLATVRRQSDAEHLLEEQQRRLSDSSNPDKHGDIVPLLLDVDKHESVQAALEKWRYVQRQRPGSKLVGVVCNAGICPSVPVECMSFEHVQAVVNTNILGVVDLAQTFLPDLRESKGRLLLIGSMNGSVSVPIMGVYSMSKFALEGLADAMRVELRPHGVAVILIKPGAIKTPAFDKAASSLTAGVSKPMEQLYGPLLEAGRSTVLETRDRGLDPYYSSQVIVDALQTRFPPGRYMVGTDSILLSYVRRALFSDDLWDGLLTMVLRQARQKASKADEKHSPEDDAASAMRRDSSEIAA